MNKITTCLNCRNHVKPRITPVADLKKYRYHDWCGIDGDRELELNKDNNCKYFKKKEK